MNERLKTHSKTQKKSADLVSNKLRIGVFQRYQMKCKSVSKKSPRYINGWCRETIFNLKLPMKKRYEEVSHNLAYIQAQLDEHGINAQIQARQLYHDREEVTVHVRRIWAAVGGRRDER
ncbi:hypothetical protein DC22_07510 [Escherichia coli]|nr:hypothetical protein DC22_07510 [Escherichia coli]